LKIDLSQAFAGQRVGVKQVEEKIWLVSFMRYDLGFFEEDQTRVTQPKGRLEPLERLGAISPAPRRNDVH
jgi:hypothetical protein